MKLPEPSAERGQLSLQQGVPRPRAAAHASPLCTSFFFFFSSFLLLPLLLPSHQGEGGCCVTGRAAVLRERVISIPCWPTCRRHKVPTKEKASRCHPNAREAPNVVVQARIVCCAGRPIKVFEGTKFDINSKWSLCASISPATAKLVSPPYHAGCRRTLPVDEEAPGIYV